MRGMADDSVDLCFGSPPYEAARTYGIGFKLKGQAWVDWMVERIVEMVRICKGLVAMVVEGQTRQYQWTATPALLMADLHRKGIKLRKPPVFARIGIPGSGGPDWLRNDYEFIVCCTKGKLLWSENTALGHTPKWAPGGAMSNRMADGARVNQWGAVGGPNGMGNRFRTSAAGRPSHVNGKKRTFDEKIAAGAKKHTKADADGHREQAYLPPVKANPGNVIRMNVGGGLLGSQLAHENEAPFPERLAEFFVRSFCPPDGITLDPFSGSGTTARVAQRHGRRYIAIDCRESQCELTAKRLAEPEKPAKRNGKPVKVSPLQQSLFPA